MELTGESRNKPQLYNQLIYEKGDQNTQYGKDFFNKWC